MQLEELDVADGLLEHGDQVDLGDQNRHQLLQRPQPLADPLPPILQQESRIRSSEHRRELEWSTGSGRFNIETWS